jgi:hypothetical protein
MSLGFIRNTLAVSNKLCRSIVMPVYSKARMALDMSECDLYCERRLGVSGSGSMLLIMENKGEFFQSTFTSPYFASKITRRSSI